MLTRVGIWGRWNTLRRKIMSKRTFEAVFRIALSGWISSRIARAILTVESDGIEVRFYGEVAVVMGRWTYTSKSGGSDAVSYSRWTSVWTRESDGWKRHTFQNTYINPNADRQVTAVEH